MQVYLELLGYLASVLVALSLTMSSLLKLRLISLAGSTTFVIYAFLIKAYPIVAVNCVIVVINIYFLHRMFTSKTYFELLEVNSDSTYLQYFLEFYREDIKHFIPEYRFAPDKTQMIIFVLRNMVPAGLFIGRKNDQGELKIFLDFVIPDYRDLKIGTYLYYKSQFFQQHGIRKLISTPKNKAHDKYLQRMGFQQEMDDKGDSIRCLSLQS